jgi:hypothetical protein
MDTYLRPQIYIKLQRSLFVHITRAKRRRHFIYFRKKNNFKKLRKYRTLWPRYEEEYTFSYVLCMPLEKKFLYRPIGIKNTRNHGKLEICETVYMVHHRRPNTLKTVVMTAKPGVNFIKQFLRLRRLKLWVARSNPPGYRKVLNVV